MFVGVLHSFGHNETSISPKLAVVVYTQDLRERHTAHEHGKLPGQTHFVGGDSNPQRFPARTERELVGGRRGYHQQGSVICGR